MESIEDLQGFIRLAKRSPQGRYVLHIRMSALERPFRDSYYRRAVGAALRPLRDKHGGKVIRLVDGEIIVATRGLGLGVIEPHIARVRRELSDSGVIRALKPVPGMSDAFIEWYDLENDFDRFKREMESLITRVVEGRPASPTAAGTRPPPVTETTDPEGRRHKTIDFRAIVREHRQPQEHVRDVDAETFARMVKGLEGTDLSGLMVRQTVMGMVAGDDQAPVDQVPQAPVLMHLDLPMEPAFQQLLKKGRFAVNPWFRGYLQDTLSERLLAGEPDVQNRDSLATMVRTTSFGVLSDVFARFDHGLGSWPRSKVILEFPAIDLQSNPAQCALAFEEARERGFRLALAGLDPQSLLWPDLKLLGLDFIKLRCPAEPVVMWLDEAVRQRLKTLLSRWGAARTILDRVDDGHTLAEGRKLGFSLFQGDAVSPAVPLAEALAKG
ncbi:hypothetical protein [Yunchengibacter salinarum]|uniref:hypothetical protein n=1 Tax=Yunchengibacter salinarum TaxID=3133399 RepID=UPI0035B5C440